MFKRFLRRIAGDNGTAGGQQRALDQAGLNIKARQDQCARADQIDRLVDTLIAMHRQGELKGSLLSRSMGWYGASSAWRNSSNIASATSGEMPMPVSRTEKRSKTVAPLRGRAA